MSEEMKFPDTLDEFIKQYSFIDEEQIYTNGSELIQTFRIKQWEEHKKQENQSLKKQLEEKNKPQIFIDTQDMEERYSEGLYQDYLEEENKKYKNKQKEFIEYMNKTIEELECDDVDDEEIKGYLIQRIDTFKEILSKYKEIIGDDK